MPVEKSDPPPRKMFRLLRDCSRKPNRELFTVTPESSILQICTRSHTVCKLDNWAKMIMKGAFRTFKSIRKIRDVLIIGGDRLP
jgi:L-lysine 2,3-aminomutase